MSDAPGLLEADAVIVGGGLAGLWAALHLPEDWKVIVVDKGTGPDVGSSPWAQGGMAVAVHPDDSPELHAQDTIRAGAGACNEHAVGILVSEAPAALSDLVALGCRFDRAGDGSFDLNLEAGQTVARSVHAADATGREIMRVVVSSARRRARRVVGSATKLLVSHGLCAGVRIATDRGDIDLVARATLLAVGGCGSLYEATTNPPSATGDGIALAYEAGAEVSDCEFVQFHPTALAVGGQRRVLLTEALRGEGAIVVDEEGKRFLFDAHPNGELAPRDVVARAIEEQGGAFLDARPIGADVIRRRFPNITAAVAEAGFDLTMAAIPVAPAAHYFLGGVSTDTSGRTRFRGLYAAGECAATAVHGANRMAGNSLTEAVVFGRRAAQAMTADAPDRAPDVDARADEVPPVRPIDPTAWGRLRTALTRGAGLVRTEAALAEAEAEIAEIAATAPAALRAGAVAAGLICRSGRLRDESRGAHFRADAVNSDPEWEGRHVRLTPG